METTFSTNNKDKLETSLSLAKSGLVKYSCNSSVDLLFDLTEEIWGCSGTVRWL